VGAERHLLDMPATVTPPRRAGGVNHICEFQLSVYLRQWWEHRLPSEILRHDNGLANMRAVYTNWCKYANGADPNQFSNGADLVMNIRPQVATAPPHHHSTRTQSSAFRALSTIASKRLCTAGSAPSSGFL
jgi:hypothetical protein